VTNATTGKSAVQMLAPYTVNAANPPLLLAGGARAGNWVFASGLMPTHLAAVARPLSGEPQWTLQFRSLWERARDVLHAGGSDLSRTVRADQFLCDYRAMPFFHEVRRDACGRHIPPSTSVLEAGLLLPEAGLSMNLVALATGGPAVTPLFPEGLDVPATSSFVPVLKAGGLAFVAGLMAAHGKGDLGGIAPEAKVPEGHLWKGNRIQLELDYLLKKKLIPALEGAGSSLARVVKADVFVTDMGDVPAFNQVWARAFGGRVPATTFVPTIRPGLAIADARVEINLVATCDDLQAERIELPEARHGVCDGHAVAMRAGDLLLFSGMVAADAGGLVARARRDATRPYFDSAIDAQMEHLLAMADAVCRKAGTRLENVVRIQQAHTDLAEFYPACKAWQQRLPGVALPMSAFQVPAPLLVPGCTVQLDLWVYAP
jgi:enamine deaminase RidA (YjgF/YER057c/UK114 family)